MNDLQKMCELFEHLNIPYTINNVKMTVRKAPSTHNLELTIEEGVGYQGFVGIFCFMDGKFVAYGLWE